jgi:hypothetical protein
VFKDDNVFKFTDPFLEIFGNSEFFLAGIAAGSGIFLQAKGHRSPY